MGPQCDVRKTAVSIKAIKIVVIERVSTIAWAQRLFRFPGPCDYQGGTELDPRNSGFLRLVIEAIQVRATDLGDAVLSRCTRALSCERVLACYLEHGKRNCAG